MQRFHLFSWSFSTNKITSDRNANSWVVSVSFGSPQSVVILRCHMNGFENSYTVFLYINPTNWPDVATLPWRHNTIFCKHGDAHGTLVMLTCLQEQTIYSQSHHFISVPGSTTAIKYYSPVVNPAFIKYIMFWGRLHFVVLWDYIKWCF